MREEIADKARAMRATGLGPDGVSPSTRTLLISIRRLLDSRPVESRFLLLDSSNSTDPTADRMGPFEDMIVSDVDSSSVGIDGDMFSERLAELDPFTVDTLLVPNLLEREMKPTSLVGTGTVILSEAGEEIVINVGRIEGTAIETESEIEFDSGCGNEADEGGASFACNS